MYELVLREGSDADVLAYIDGALLVDLWDELVLPRAVRAAWSPLIDQVRGVVDARPPRQAADPSPTRRRQHRAG
jgi:hypothetical protein